MKNEERLIVWLHFDVPKDVEDVDREWGMEENVQYVQELEEGQVKLLFDTPEQAEEFMGDNDYNNYYLDIDSN